MVLVKMLMEMMIPMMNGVLVMTMASISPSRREVSLAELLRWRAKVFRLGSASQTAVEYPNNFM
jgi:hypothetical protein